MQRIHLNIGSNMGDRKALIAGAVALIFKRLGPGRMPQSDFYESEPWGYDSTLKYLNVAVMIDRDTPLSPLDILEATRAVELAVGGGAPHRNADGSYRDRPVDIDIIDVDGIVIDTPRLTLPHPRAALRDFVIEPLRSLDPDTAARLTKG